MGFKDMFKGTGATMIERLPEPFKQLLTLKSDQERRTYLESLPHQTMKSMFKWVTYVLLSGDVLGKAVKWGVKIPEEIKDFLEKVNSEVKNAGKLTIQTVDRAVEMVQTTVKVAIAIPIILFGAFLLLNPAAAAGLLITATAIEASAWLFGASQKGWRFKK